MTGTSNIPDGAQGASDPGPRRSLILAGGGMRVAYQAGVVKALFEAGLTFSHADGTSGGTMNLAMLLSGLSADEMCDRWRTLDVKDFASLMPAGDYLEPAELEAVGTAQGIVDKVFPHLGVDMARINAAQGMAGTFNVCDFSSKTSEVIPHAQLDMDYLVAGISLPIFMPPVAKAGSLYMDSVWIRDANLMEAVRRGAEEIWVVWCIGNAGVYRRGAFNQYVHMIELSANGALFGDFERIGELNAAILAGGSPGGRTRPIRLHLVRPQWPLPLDPDYFLGRIDAATLIAMGYADAKTYIATMRPEGLPWTPEVTRMNDPKLGIAFREVMSGGFALGETDPATGAAKGKNSGDIMAMHAAITIQDVDRFIADPDHVGQINGSIDYTPFGENILATSGVFNLFSPTDNPDLKLMVYEMGFQHGGADYYVAGKKEVRKHSILDLWHDTTTLLTQLHQGTDKSGPVVGAGILSLGPLDLTKMVSTMHALNADSPVAGAEAVARFGKFFMGELWATYCRI